MKKEFEKTTTNIFSSVSSLFGVYWMTKYKFLLKEKNDLLEDNEFLEKENSRYKSLIWFLYVIIFIAFLFLAIPTRASADEITYSDSSYTMRSDLNNWYGTNNGTNFSHDFTLDSTCSNPILIWTSVFSNPTQFKPVYNISLSDYLSASSSSILSDSRSSQSGYYVLDNDITDYTISFQNDYYYTDGFIFSYNIFCNVDPDNPIHFYEEKVAQSSSPLNSNSYTSSEYGKMFFLSGLSVHFLTSSWTSYGTSTQALVNSDNLSLNSKYQYLNADYLAVSANSWSGSYNAHLWLLNYKAPPLPPFEIDWLGVGSQYFDTNFTTMLPVRYNYCNLDSSNTWHGLFFKMYKSGDTVETGYSPQGLNYEVNECSGMLELPISFVGHNVNENLIDYFSGYEGEIDLIASFDSADSATTTLTTFNSIFSSHNLSEGGYISPLFYRLDKNNIKNVNIKTVLEYETATSTEPNSLNYYIESASGYNTSASSSLDLVLYYRLPSLDNLSSSTRICLVGNHSYCSDVLTGMSATTSIPLIDIVSKADVRSNFSANSVFEFVDVVNTPSSPNFYYSVPFKVNYLFSTTYLDKSISDGSDGSDGGFIANLINSLNNRLDGLFPFSLINLFKDAWLNPNIEFTGGFVFFDRYFNESDDLVLPLPAKFVEISNGSSSVPIISANMFSESEEMTGAFAMIKDILSVIFYLVYAVFLYYLGKKTYKLLMTGA